MTMKNESIFNTPTSAWGLGVLGALLTVLWGTVDFTLWSSMIGVILLLMGSALAGKSEFTDRALLAFCAIKALCYLLVFGVIIQFFLEALPSRAWAIKANDLESGFEISLGHAVYFILWMILGATMYFQSRKGRT